MKNKLEPPRSEETWGPWMRDKLGKDFYIVTISFSLILAWADHCSPGNLCKAEKQHNLETVLILMEIILTSLR